ncbi:MAG: cytochrome ubiquinol oxidase subunit I [Myxococcota bacterium]|nr:cytochrome ubiquinol oxidase subunit I [Myxococcota bacterium]
MTDLLYARAQMGMSLAFHIIFAAIGVALPLMMVIAEWRWLRTRDPVWLELTKRWAKGTAILFAVGAVSGTVLSFELGLLWPRFMEHAGPIIGMPFSLEGFAFFTEAIFLGIYLYGWDRVGPRAHLAAGVIVAVSGAASAFFVTLVNAWMNTPTGFRIVDGEVVDIDVWGAMASPAALHEVLHVLGSCYVATAFAVAGVHAFFLLRDRSNAFHRKAVAIAMALGAFGAVFQLATGDLAASAVAEHQPVKLAAMEGQFEDEVGAPLRIGGWPDELTGETSYAIEIPGALSFLAFGDFDAPVQGLESFPREDWPPVLLTHLSFQVMVACGMLLLLLSAVWVFLAWRRRGVPDSKWMLRSIVLCAPLGFVALEAGWFVTELGRQPWIVWGVWRTASAVTPMPGLLAPFAMFSAVYVLLAAAVVFLLVHQFRAAPRTTENDDAGR